jgi:signal transduction histidine kinase
VAVLHDRTAPRWQLVAGLVLFVLLTTLGTLQYKWLGEVSEAERARMRESLQTRANEFAADFDRELTRTYLAFHFVTDTFDRDPAKAIGDAVAAAEPSGAMRFVREIYLLEMDSSPTLALRRFDRGSRTLGAVEWPPALDSWRRRVESAVPPAARPISPLFLTDAVDATAPALMIPVPKVRRLEGERHFAVLPDPAGPGRAILLWLDAAAIDATLVRALAAKYFGPADASDYVVTIVRRDAPEPPVFSSSSSVDSPAPDATAGLFDLRIDEINRAAGGLGVRVPSPSDAASAAADAQSDRVTNDRVAITIVRRATPQDRSGVLMTGGGQQGGWELRVRHRRGSLDAIVAQSRRRNLAIGLGVLALLAASFGLVIAAAHRQQRLAKQQMEFVAGVSHELRTPLAVICSAGENLSDGVVADAQQVRRYGALIQAEGRRLGDMVERVLQFAGIGSGSASQARTEVDLAAVIEDAVRAASLDARERGIPIAVRLASALPATIGDAAALRSAVQNVVGNAVKYSAAGATVEVTAEVVDERVVRIQVADRGLGIDAADLRHVFKPFFRGRRALDAQVRGTGVGLSVVRHVVQSHGGDVRIDSRAAQGTTVTIVLPVQEAADAAGGRVVRLRPGAAS